MIPVDTHMLTVFAGLCGQLPGLAFEEVNPQAEPSEARESHTEGEQLPCPSSMASKVDHRGRDWNPKANCLVDDVLCAGRIFASFGSSRRRRTHQVDHSLRPGTFGDSTRAGSLGS